MCISCVRPGVVSGLPSPAAAIVVFCNAPCSQDHELCIDLVRLGTYCDACTVSMLELIDQTGGECIVNTLVLLTALVPAAASLQECGALHSIC